jgi:hypothetical protein
MSNKTQQEDDLLSVSYDNISLQPLPDVKRTFLTTNTGHETLSFHFDTPNTKPSTPKSNISKAAKPSKKHKSTPNNQKSPEHTAKETKGSISTNSNERYTSNVIHTVNFYDSSFNDLHGLLAPQFISPGIGENSNYNDVTCNASSSIMDEVD